MQLPFQYVSASLSMAYAFVCALPCPPAFQKVALWCNIYLVLDSSIVRGGAYLIVSLLADSAARRSQIIRCRLLVPEARDAHMIARFLISPHESLAAAQSHPRPLLRPSLSKRAFVRVVANCADAVERLRRENTVITTTTAAVSVHAVWRIRDKVLTARRRG